MGNLHAAGYAEGVADGSWSLTQALTAHLTSNHYPPLPTGYVPVAVAAIAAGDERDFEARIPIPADLDPQPRTVADDGTVDASTLIAILHLDAFLDQDEE